MENFHLMIEGIIDFLKNAPFSTSNEIIDLGNFNEWVLVEMSLGNIIMGGQPDTTYSLWPILAFPAVGRPKH